MGTSSRIVSRLGEGASTKLAASVEVSEMMTEEVGITLTNVDRMTELGKVLAWSSSSGVVAHTQDLTRLGTTRQ